MAWRASKDHLWKWIFWHAPGGRDARLVGSIPFPTGGSLQERPLRVLQVFAPGSAGGLESVVQMLAPGLLARGAEVAVTAVLGAVEPEPPSVAALRAAGVEVFSHRSQPRAYISEWASHRARVTNWRPDVVHTHGYRADVLAGLAVGSRAIRVATVHGFTGGDWKNRLYERLQIRAYHRFDAVVAVSRSVGDRLRAKGIHSPRLELIPNAWAAAVEPLDRQAARRVLGLEPDALVVGWVGRLAAEKGADLLLEAVARLADPVLRTSIVGDGRERAALEARAAALSLGGRITWHGLVPGAGRLVAAFDVFVLSSRTEGTPIALFEAMAAGVPAVATAVGGVPDVLTSTEGWLVPPESPGELAAAIRGVLTSPAEARIRAARARERLNREFAAGPWFDRYLELYHHLAAGRRSLQP